MITITLSTKKQAIHEITLPINESLTKLIKLKKTNHAN